jgi:hypothetical protein
VLDVLGKEGHEARDDGDLEAVGERDYHEHSVAEEVRDGFGQSFRKTREIN